MDNHYKWNYFVLIREAETNIASECLMELAVEAWHGPFSIDRCKVFPDSCKFSFKGFCLRNCPVPGRQFHILFSSNWLKLRFYVIKFPQKELLCCSVFIQHKKSVFIKGEKGSSRYLRSLVMLAKKLVYLMSSYTPTASAGKLCADGCLDEMYIFQALKNHGSPRAFLSPAVVDP